MITTGIRVTFRYSGEGPAVTVFLCDISSNQKGLSIASVKQNGFAGVIARALSFPKGIVEVDASYAGFRDDSKAHGLLFAAYVLIHTYYPAAHQAQLLAQVIGDPSIPVMIDLEPDSDVPTIEFAAQFFDACAAEGLHAGTLYDPHWYWAQTGSGNLAVRPWVLTASDYGANLPGPASSRYETLGGDSSPAWNAYGGLAPVFWQFGSQIVLGADSTGVTVYGDADATRHTAADLVSLGVLTDWGTMTNPSAADIAAAIFTYPTTSDAADVPDHRTVPFAERFANHSARLDQAPGWAAQAHADAVAITARLDTLIGLLTPKPPALR